MYKEKKNTIMRLVNYRITLQVKDTTSIVVTSLALARSDTSIGLLCLAFVNVVNILTQKKNRSHYFCCISVLNALNCIDLSSELNDKKIERMSRGEKKSMPNAAWLETDLKLAQQKRTMSFFFFLFWISQCIV